MAFASGQVGLDISIPNTDDWIIALFSEGPGMAIQVSPNDYDYVMQSLNSVLGTDAVTSVATVLTTNEIINVRCGNSTKMSGISVRELWAEWEAVSFAVEVRQREIDCVMAEKDSLIERKPPAYKAEFFAKPIRNEIDESQRKGAMSALRFDQKVTLNNRHRVAILRCEGSNGDREMAAAFYLAGLEPWDVTMSDLADGTTNLDKFRGIAFVGGFSYADVCDSAKGWAASILCNRKLQAQFAHFFHDREDVFSLGVCNGCQLMALLGWVPGGNMIKKDDDELVSKIQPRFIHNSSGKFESRWSTVTILDSPCKLFQGMAGSVLGVWLAHGEGKAHFPESSILDIVLKNDLAPLRYADDSGAVSANYPYCPNGSPNGIAGLCSPDGRHLAIMPHPERAVLSWQWPWQNSNILSLCSQRQDNASPWLRLFQNAKLFLDDFDFEKEVSASS
mmetsp:Transcript_18182/g.23680  ORF Transcript_18182/g.23680 Transcript_18182/m.23680 type:complete len:448 (-) Transcript_18182:102-1445(-)